MVCLLRFFVPSRAESSDRCSGRRRSKAKRVFAGLAIWVEIHTGFCYNAIIKVHAMLWRR